MTTAPSIQKDPAPLALSARDIRLSYPAMRGQIAREVLHGIDLSLSPGESVALVGESGSGKSSLARVLVQLLPPSSGEVFLFGESLTAKLTRSGPRLIMPRGPKPWRRKLQMVFQNAAGSLNARFSVAESIAEPLEIFAVGTKKTQLEQVHSLLEEVGLDADLAHRRPHELSGGQRQRVAIARALALDPAVLVADEPTSALDATLKRQVLVLLASLQQRRNLTLLLVSHDLGAVAQLCSRTLVMQAGAIVEEGPTKALLGAPTHPYTQSLVAAVPRLRVPSPPQKPKGLSE